MLISNSHALNFDNLTILLEIVFTFFLWFHCMFEMLCLTTATMRGRVCDCNLEIFLLQVFVFELQNNIV